MKSLTLFTSLMVAASSVLAYPSSHQRTCMIPPARGDASDNIINTFKKCNKNSRVVFNKNHDYYVEKPMNITGLDNVHISIQGNVTFSDKDMTWWQENMFLLDFQSAGTWWIISGKDIHVDGGGTVNGQGQVWWDAVAKDPRPVTMVFDKVDNLHVSDINIIQAPFWHVFARDINHGMFTDLYIHSKSNSSAKTRNSDFIDLYRSTDVVVKDSVIVNSDDCVSFKPNATNIVVKNLDCTGSHGLSVGSLGQYAKDGEIDVVRDILVQDITCKDCQNGARIKTWPGGKGLVQNITFDHMEVTNAENPIVITTHYCDNNQMDYCNGSDDESLSIQDVTFNDIYGSVSGEKSNPIINMNCSINSPCSDIILTDINIKAADNTPENVCDHVTNAEEIPYCPQYKESA
ncbi:hypothetical protein LRAMOSA04336 [Lichtheimia ramosa]|uniref:Uncharacterized protein n=1 Tax=Lichtheimia ramosa TaxID=688394 RepID=A0A077WWZ8_9FUNG|nr:hypothetical protein LRAMOSA04336 [Lichtheimia ramosa]